MIRAGLCEAGVRTPASEVYHAAPDQENETRLSVHPPRYWELEIKANTPGLDLNGTFVVPVYAKPDR